VQDFDELEYPDIAELIVWDSVKHVEPSDDMMVCEF
jgi:hypothetical protein